jgi:hypothetical protein
MVPVNYFNNVKAHFYKYCRAHIQQRSGSKDRSRTRVLLRRQTLNVIITIARDF